MNVWNGVFNPITVFLISVILCTLNAFMPKKRKLSYIQISLVIAFCLLFFDAWAGIFWGLSSFLIPHYDRIYAEIQRRLWL